MLPHQSRVQTTPIVSRFQLREEFRTEAYLVRSGGTWNDGRQVPSKPIPVGLEGILLRLTEQFEALTTCESETPNERS